MTYFLRRAVAVLLLLAVALLCGYEICAVSASERYSPSGFFFGVSAIALLFICRMVFNGNDLDVDEYVRKAYKFAYSDCIEMKWVLWQAYRNHQIPMSYILDSREGLHIWDFYILAHCWNFLCIPFCMVSSKKVSVARGYYISSCYHSWMLYSSFAYQYLLDLY